MSLGKTMDFKIYTEIAQSADALIFLSKEDDYIAVEVDSRRFGQKSFKLPVESALNEQTARQAYLNACDFLAEASVAVIAMKSAAPANTVRYDDDEEIDDKDLYWWQRD